jgi:hypothetical protein
MAAPGPMPLDLAAEVLEWDRELAVRTRARVGSYLVEDQGGLSLFHKNLGEWLGSESAALYFTDAEPTANKLGTFLWERFDEREKDANDLPKPLRWEPFVGIGCQALSSTPREETIGMRSRNWHRGSMRKLNGIPRKLYITEPWRAGKKLLGLSIRIQCRV